jgi:hypothetical protein
MVLMDVLIELHDFVSYITALPMKAAGYRVGSLLCVLPAYQTILKAVQSHNKLFTSEHDIKIPRLTFYHCLRDARSIASSNNAIMRYRDEIAEWMMNSPQHQVMLIRFENRELGAPESSH